MNDINERFGQLNFVTPDACSLRRMANKYYPYTMRQSFPLWTCISKEVQFVEGMELPVIRDLADRHPEINKMYGSPEELWENLKTFIDFQGNLQYFEVNPCVSYNHRFFIHKDISSDKKFLFKNDIFLSIQDNLIVRKPVLRNRVSLIMLTYFLKYHEKKLGTSCQFVEYVEKDFDKLIEELNDFLEDFIKETKPVARDAIFDWEQVFTRLRNMLPEPMTEEEMSPLADVLKRFFETYPRAHAVGVLNMIEQFCQMMVPRLEKIMAKRPEWFLPNSTKNAKPVLRYFMDGDQQFVMVPEYEIATKERLQYTDPSFKSTVIDTIKLSDVSLIASSNGGSLSDFYCIRFNIERTKHTARPIRTATGRFCKLSADVLLEHLRDLFFGSRVFQSPTRTMFNGYVISINEFFNSNTQGIYFLEESTIELVDKISSGLFGIPEPTTIRDVPPKGFTVGYVHAELMYLGLLEFFPNICKYAEIAYKKVVAEKKKKILRTCDMYDAVEICMMLAVFNGYPELAQFLHTQHACHRIHGLQCKKCELEKKHPMMNSWLYPYMEVEEDEEVVSTSSSDDEEKRTSTSESAGNGRKSEQKKLEVKVPEPTLEKETRESKCCESTKDQLKAFQEQVEALKKEMKELETAMSKNLKN